MYVCVCVYWCALSEVGVGWCDVDYGCLLQSLRVLGSAIKCQLVAPVKHLLSSLLGVVVGLAGSGKFCQMRSNGA